jgi:riboflavin kinase/FMN adenylyltransferase
MTTRTLTGKVITGDRRGRLLGFPTANLAMPDDTDPDLAFGVYAGRALGRPAAISIGVRPTYGSGLEPLVEVHILDFQGDLYDEILEVELLTFLRPELEFGSSDALVAQIEEDVDAVRTFVGQPGSPPAS